MVIDFWQFLQQVAFLACFVFLAAAIYALVERRIDTGAPEPVGHGNEPTPPVGTTENR
jgi:hypothetical protein